MRFSFQYSKIKATSTYKSSIYLVAVCVLTLSSAPVSAQVFVKHEEEISVAQCPEMRPNVLYDSEATLYKIIPQSGTIYTNAELPLGKRLKVEFVREDKKLSARLQCQIIWECNVLYEHDDDQIAARRTAQNKCEALNVSDNNFSFEWATGTESFWQAQSSFSTSVDAEELNTFLHKIWCSQFRQDQTCPEFSSNNLDYEKYWNPNNLLSNLLVKNYMKEQCEKEVPAFVKNNLEAQCATIAMISPGSLKAVDRCCSHAETLPKVDVSNKSDNSPRSSDS